MKFYFTEHFKKLITCNDRLHISTKSVILMIEIKVHESMCEWNPSILNTFISRRRIKSVSREKKR